MIQRISMNRYPVRFFRGAVVLLCLAAGAAATGSPRPVVQKNFQRLIETNSCPSCDLAGAVLNRIDLSGANLEGANLAGARLYLADLSGANLRNANLQGAGLGGADLARADLRGANLTGAVLEGAYLKDALMDGVVTTRHSADEEGVTGAGETVVVGDDSRSKHKPYTQDVVVAPRQDLATMPPAEAMPAKEKAAAVQGDDQTGAAAPTRLQSQATLPEPGPKRLSPMADAVVPATVVPAPPEHGAGEVVELAAVTKEKVAAAEAAQAGPAAPVDDRGAAPLPRQAGSGRTPAGTDESPAANKDAMGGDTEPRDVPGAGEKTTVEVRDEEPARPPEPEQAAAAEQAAQPEEAAGKSSTLAGAAAGSGSEEAAGEPTGAGRAADAAAAGTMGQQTTAVKTTVQKEAATVSGLQPATNPRQVLVERLLDENQCPECDLQGADLSGRRLGDADLERANLRDANLEEADLENANLKGADLRGANLRKADLRGADLYLARLAGADLTGARMEGTLVDSADFTGAVGVPVDLAGKEE